MTEASNASDAANTAPAKSKEEIAAEKKAARETAKAEKQAAREKARAEKKAAKEAEKAKNKQPENNGIRRPKPGTITGKLWDLFDQLSRDTGVPATIGDAMKKSEGTADATVRTQYARWRKFNGVTGRAAPAPAKSEGTASA